MLRPRFSSVNSSSFLVLCSLIALTGTILFTPASYADNDTAVDDVTINVPITCTLSGSGMNSHNATINPGTSNSAIGTTNMNVVCNDSNGFAIYAIGYTNDTDGDNTLTSTTLSPAQTIATGTALSGNSQWAMKLATITSPTPAYPITIMNSFDSFHTVPDDYTLVAKRTSATDMGQNAVGSSFSSTYQAYISPSQPADTYQGQVKYVLVHPHSAPAPVAPLQDTDCPANKICYAPNNGDIAGSMDSISATKITKSPTAGVQTKVSGSSSAANITSNSTVTLIAPNYSRAGYGFAGWSTEFDATTATNPVIYGPNQDITTSTSGTGDVDVSQHGLILYPVWIASAGNLQGWTGCSSLTAASYNSSTGVLSATLASITALTDQRDGNVYTVARLADGNCWMTENLRLNAENTTGDANKNLSQGYATSTTYGDFTGLATSENANFSDSTTANSLYSIDGSTTNTIKGGNSSYRGYRFPRYNNNNTNRNLDPSYNGYGSGTTYYQWHSYGNYYTWAAAMANVKEYSGPTSTDDEGKTSETANTFICPSGWRLPYGNSTGNGATAGGFSYLDTRMGGTGSDQSGTAGTAQSKKWRSFPNNFVYSGFFSAASADGRGAYGYYWSSTASSYYYSYGLRLDSSYFIPGHIDINKYSGRSIRCISNS